MISGHSRVVFLVVVALSIILACAGCKDSRGSSTQEAGGTAAVSPGGPPPGGGPLAPAAALSPLAVTSGRAPVALARDADFLYAAGVEALGGGDIEWRIEKTRLTDGAPFGLFGSSGVVTENPSPGDDRPTALAVDDTFLYVVGFDEQPGAGDSQWRIEKRLLANGQQARSFGVDGVVIENPSALDDRAMAIAIQSGFLYIAGFSRDPDGNPIWRIEKRDASDGLLAPFRGTHEETGVLTSAIGQPIAMALNVRYMVIAGTDWRIEKRELTTGALELDFDQDGILIAGAGSGQPTALVLDQNDLFITGYDERSPGDLEWRIEKRNFFSGGINPGFGLNGVMTENPSTGDDRPMSLALDDFKSLFLAGFDERRGPGDFQWRIEKRNPQGFLDTSFGRAGVMTEDFGPLDDEAAAIVVDPLQLHVAGFSEGPAAGNFEWRVLRVRH